VDGFSWRYRSHVPGIKKSGNRYGNNPYRCKIIQTYIQTPLIWGIHVSGNSNYNHISEIENTTAAISRYGSGSHLMSYINAQNQGWDISNLQFEVVKNLDGAVTGLTQGTSDYFMWEHFTTKPLVDNGTFKRIADCPTPWPCFVIAVREDVLSNKEKEIKNILDIINTVTMDFKKTPNIDRILSTRYEQRLEDIREWLQITEWSQSLITQKTLDKVQNELFKLNLIENKVDSKSLIQKI